MRTFSFFKDVTHWSRSAGSLFLVPFAALLMLFTSHWNKAHAAGYGYITVDRPQNLHSRGNSRSSVLGTISPREQAPLLSSIDKYRYWVKIEYRGQTSWVRKNQVTHYRERTQSLESRRTEAAASCPGGNCQDPRNWSPVNQLASQGRAISEATQSNRSQSASNPVGSPSSASGHASRLSEATIDKLVKEVRSIANDMGGIRRSMRRCYRAVKLALQSAGVVSSYLSGGKAIQAHTDGTLRAHGFRDYMGTYDSLSAPRGCLLVYEDTKKHSGAGHIEIVTEKGGQYCSDYCSQTPIDWRVKNGKYVRVKTRKLQGVYCK